MKKIDHVIICYGNNLGYHHGAKYQILSAYDQWYSNNDSSTCVVTDKPELFESYPCRLLELDSEKCHKWSLRGTQHFGIKLQGILWALRTSPAKCVLALDTDMYWIKDPSRVADKVTDSSIAMYRNEGFVYNTNNLSIKRFEEGLKGKNFDTTRGQYSLTHDSQMWASNILGLNQSHRELLEYAFELFSTLDPHVEAHTVEQYSIAEAARILNFEKHEALRYLSNWSSTGRKNYVTPVLDEFFQRYGENNFNEHLLNWRHIKIRRPILKFINQKLNKTFRRA